ncbi:uncharacterized protein LOC122298980 [Carya illinoinensis]|uniref:uncharacterized protein LOC122298980 n=1 Tax=Carya illinoinensis TaxID=32201 RepID=UPI001C71E067|nr:uncharacterized protein LOC122298980 [Carya illinoinensis]
MDVWGKKETPLKKWSSNYQDFSLLWEDLIDKLDTEFVDYVATILHKLWSRRNSFVFHNKFLSPLVLIRTAVDDIDVCKEIHLNLSVEASNISMQTSNIQWRPQSDPFFKLNFDAAYDSEKRMMGIGIVVRNSRSETMIVISTPRNYVSYMFSIECYALLRSLNLDQELGLQQVIIEGDAKTVIEGFIGINSNCSSQGQLLDDIQHLMLGHADWKLNFVKRSGNKAAHIATKLGMYLESEAVWIEDGPPEVMSAILIEKQCTEVLS